MDDGQERVHVWVRGRVQGVGFRAYVQSQAVGIGVTGWVRNVGHDTVEAVAEGGAEQVAAFLRAVGRGPAGSRVDDLREAREAATGEFASFAVKASIESAYPGKSFNTDEHR